MASRVFGHRNSFKEDVAILDKGDVVLAVAESGLISHIYLCSAH